MGYELNKQRQTGHNDTGMTEQQLRDYARKPVVGESKTEKEIDPSAIRPNNYLDDKYELTKIVAANAKPFEKPKESAVSKVSYLEPSWKPAHDYKGY